MTNTSQEMLVASEEEASQRLDKVLTSRFPTFSRTYFQSLIEKGSVLCNGSPVKKRVKLKAGDEIEICFELTPEISLDPEDIPLDILFEDEDIIIVNKPPGMVVHPAPGHFRGTFVNALLFHCKEIERQSESPLRPGIVHRLDKDTSGVLVAAKTSFAHRALVTMFSEREVEKHYLAICLGVPKVETIEAPLKRHPVKRQEMSVCEGGRHATTHLSILKTKDNICLLDLDLVTGRTHQIRVHLKHINCPIIGDFVYGIPPTNVKFGAKRQLLHAHTLELTHPKTGERLKITAPMPKDMEDFISSNLS